MHHNDPNNVLRCLGELVHSASHSLWKMVRFPNTFPASQPENGYISQPIPGRGLIHSLLGTGTFPNTCPVGNGPIPQYISGREWVNLPIDSRPEMDPFPIGN